MENQKDQERQDLIGVVEEIRQNIIAFLKAFNLKAKGNQISIQFSKDLENSHYKQLFEIEGEPSVFRINLTLENIISKEPQEVQNVMQLLICKLQRDDFPSTTGTPFTSSDSIVNSCTHYNSIEIKNNKVKLIGAICYCN